MILDNSEYVTKAICKPRASGDDPVRSASAHLSTL